MEIQIDNSIYKFNATEVLIKSNKLQEFKPPQKFIKTK